MPIRVAGTSAYVPVNIDIETGRLDPVTAAERFVTPSNGFERAADEVRADAGGVAIPDWPVLLDAGREAHRHVDALFAVAWDFVVGPDGPILLEGNSSWGATVPQQVRGPYLADMETS